MEFGLFNLMSYRQHPRGVPGVVADAKLMVGLAEEIGLDTAWFAEHHFTNYSVSVSPLMMAAHMAGLTRRIRLGTAVIVLPLYQPMRVAQEIALVDQLSGGRLVLGVGTGYQPFEFDRYGVDVTTRGDIFLKYWDVLEEALTTGAVTGSARALGLPEAPMLLRPVQTPLPPLYVTGGDPRIIARLGPLGATPFITAGWRGSEALIAMGRKTRADWAAAGFPATGLGVQQYVHVTDDPAEALIAADCARFVGRMATGLRAKEIGHAGPMIDAPPLPDEPPLETFRDNVIIGSAAQVTERILAERAAMNPTHYNMFFQFGDMPLAMAARALERFGAEVLPVLRRETAATPADATA
ncbi:LLM class flavin-dependent oxidoreductase [Amaricoccus solimangrovi]|uniref:LLM class flavin-dependent oxidoreductase n=1 Tax=Amaricoccus solimangrovi TaxID=2589815 RepID=A0A501WGV7_9RHOB|nr:LLM class flavin-dependent oxidoreductase [Amaricoccus solimangrovi]TPE47715.1 LLM class flavin-dependent oxidoreductase [Amaricoccus solimangrovi]